MLGNIIPNSCTINLLTNFQHIKARKLNMRVIRLFFFYLYREIIVSLKEAIKHIQWNIT